MRESRKVKGGHLLLGLFFGLARRLVDGGVLAVVHSRLPAALRDTHSASSVSDRCLQSAAAYPVGTHSIKGGDLAPGTCTKPIPSWHSCGSSPQKSLRTVHGPLQSRARWNTKSNGRTVIGWRACCCVLHVGEALVGDVVHEVRLVAARLCHVVVRPTEQVQACASTVSAAKLPQSKNGRHKFNTHDGLSRWVGLGGAGGAAHPRR